MISNVYGDDNRGGSALTQAAIQAVRAAVPGSRITLVAVNGAGSDLAQTHRHTLAANPDVQVVPALVSVGGRDDGLLAVGLSLVVLALPKVLLRRVPAVAVVARADLVVGKGGQLFRTRGRRAQLGLWLAMFPLLVAARLGKPTVVYGQAFGPFAGGSGERLSAWLLRRVDLVLLRDDRSVQLAAAPRADGPTGGQVPDTVLVSRPSDRRRRRRGRPSAGCRRSPVRSRHADPSAGTPLCCRWSAGADDRPRRPSPGPRHGRRGARRGADQRCRGQRPRRLAGAGPALRRPAGPARRRRPPVARPGRALLARRAGRGRSGALQHPEHPRWHPALPGGQPAGQGHRPVREHRLRGARPRARVDVDRRGGGRDRGCPVGRCPSTTWSPAGTGCERSPGLPTPCWPRSGPAAGRRKRPPSSDRYRSASALPLAVPRPAGCPDEAGRSGVPRRRRMAGRTWSSRTSTAGRLSSHSAPG